MNADRLSRWMTLGANFAVLVGIVLVLVELQQNRQMMRAQIRHDLAAGIVDILSVPANNRQLADVLYKAQSGEAMTPEDLYQYRLRTNALFRYWEDVHYQYRIGLYDKDEFERQREAWRASLAASPVGRAYWCEVQALYAPAFAEEMNNLLGDDPCSTEPAPK